MIDFSPLWVTMKEKNITQYQLIKSGIDNKTLESLCRILGCTPNDVVRFMDEPAQETDPETP